MKKLFTTLFVAMAMNMSAVAQDVNVSEPVFIDEFNQYGINTIGVSQNGRFVYGIDPTGSVGVYDFEGTNKYTTVSRDKLSSFPVSVAGSTTDGRLLISTYLTSYFLNMNDGTKQEIKSPDSNYGIDAWDISADGKIIVCNLTSDGFTVIPMIGTLQEDGTYNLEYLEYDKNDAMGSEAQYSQVRYVSDDGQYLMGVQPDYVGMAGRLVVWERQDDGTYKFTTPMDDFIYDLSCEKPGNSPIWEEYVTADPIEDADLYNEQSKKYEEARMEFLDKYFKFTKNCSSFEMFMMVKAARSNIMCTGYYDYSNENGGMIPVFYDCDTKTVTSFPDMMSSNYSEFIYGVEQLPGGGFIVAKLESSGNVLLTAIDKEGNREPFEKWIEKKTGTDISKYYIESYDEGTYLGVPFFSVDGKNLVISGRNSDSERVTSVLRFDKDLFADVPTGISNIETTDVMVDGSRINVGTGKNAVADVYTIDGCLMYSYNITGSYDFGKVLKPGMYVVKVNVEGQKSSTIKLLIK